MLLRVFSSVEDNQNSFGKFTNIVMWTVDLERNI